MATFFGAGGGLVAATAAGAGCASSGFGFACNDGVGGDLDFPSGGPPVADSVGGIDLAVGGCCIGGCEADSVDGPGGRCIDCAAGIGLNMGGFDGMGLSTAPVAELSPTDGEVRGCG